MLSPLEIAMQKLSHFETTRLAYYPWSIDSLTGDIYDHFKAASEPVGKGSLLEERIQKAVVRAHLLGASERLAELETPDMTCSPRNILEIEKIIRIHFEGAGEPVDKDSSLDKRIQQAVVRAHLLRAEKNLAELEGDLSGYNNGRAIHALAHDTVDHFKAAGECVEPNSPLFRRIKEATFRGYGVSAEKSLTELEHSWDGTFPSGVRRQAYDIYEQFKTSGVDVSRGSPTADRIRKAVIRGYGVFVLTSVSSFVTDIVDHFKTGIVDRFKKETPSPHVESPIQQSSRLVFEMYDKSPGLRDSRNRAMLRWLIEEIEWDEHVEARKKHGRHAPGGVLDL